MCQQVIIEAGAFAEKRLIQLRDGGKAFKSTPLYEKTFQTTCKTVVTNVNLTTQEVRDGGGQWYPLSEFELLFEEV